MIALLLAACLPELPEVTECDEVEVNDWCWSVLECCDAYDCWTETKGRKHYCEDDCSEALEASKREACE